MTIPSGVMPPAAPASGAKGTTAGDGSDPATGDAFAALVATFLPRQLPQHVPDQLPKGGAIPGLTQTTPGDAAQLVAVDATPAAPTSGVPAPAPQDSATIALDTPATGEGATTSVATPGAKRPDPQGWAAGIDLTDAKPPKADTTTPPASQGLSHRAAAAHMPPDFAPAIGLRGRTADPVVIPDPPAADVPAEPAATGQTPTAAASDTTVPTPAVDGATSGAATPAATVTMPTGQQEHASATALARSHGQWSRSARAGDGSEPAKTTPADSATPTSASSESVAPATPAGTAHNTTDEDADDVDTPTTPVGATDHVARPATPAVGHTDAVQRAEAPTRPEPATPPHQQIVSVIEPLRRRGDGSYDVTLRLNPDDLGPVDLHVQLHRDAIELHMHTDHEQARAMLNEHLGDLRHELTQAGFRPTTVDVSDGRSRQQAPAFSAPQTPAGPSTGVSTATEAVAPVTVGATGQSTDNLDVRI